MGTFGKVVATVMSVSASMSTPIIAHAVSPVAVLPSDHTTMASSIVPSLRRAPVQHAARVPRSKYSLTLALDPPQPGLPAPTISGPAGRPLVVIDAGHGGHDPGARSPTGREEKDLTLSIALAIRDDLLRGGRVRVAMTRVDDRFLILQERREIARQLKAGLFLSIHADAGPSTDATGATIYTVSEVASDQNAAQIAARENKADVINGVNLSGKSEDISSILIDLAQRETTASSVRFATLLKREGAGIAFRPDYHRMAGFVVLKAPDTPSILFEVGYLTNPVDADRLFSRAGRAIIARSVRRAVDIFFARQSITR
jgi:N-acetylmuramoyl-L-alanine amidase